MAPFFVVKSEVVPFFVVKWPPNLIGIVMLKGSNCPESDEKLVPNIIDKNNPSLLNVQVKSGNSVQTFRSELLLAGLFCESVSPVSHSCFGCLLNASSEEVRKIPRLVWLDISS